jgi:hypothetical protein
VIISRSNDIKQLRFKILFWLYFNVKLRNLVQKECQKKSCVFWRLYYLLFDVVVNNLFIIIFENKINHFNRIIQSWHADYVSSIIQQTFYFIDKSLFKRFNSQKCNFRFDKYFSLENNALQSIVQKYCASLHRVPVLGMNKCHDIVTKWLPVLPSTANYRNRITLLLSNILLNQYTITLS